MSDNFGDFIKEKRARCNYSLKYVAEIIGISNVYQSSIEAGKRPAPSYDVLMKFLTLQPKAKIQGRLLMILPIT